MDHPPGFYARPSKDADGTTNIKIWECGIPGKEGTDWEGGVYGLKLYFKDEYPSKAPEVLFSPPIFHPNVFSQGQICLSLLKEDQLGGWQASITLKQCLMAIQEMLDTPNADDPANSEAARLYRYHRGKYSAQIKAYAASKVSDT